MIQDPGSNLFLWRQRVAAGERRAAERAWLCCVTATSRLGRLLERLAAARADSA